MDSAPFSVRQTPGRAMNESTVSQADTAKKPGSWSGGKGICEKRASSVHEDASEFSCAHAGSISNGVNASPSVPVMNSRNWSPEIQGVDDVVSRIHSVRSSMRGHTETNEALLRSLAERICEGQKTGESNMSKAIAALERQRQETTEARVECQRLQDALLVAQHELQKSLEDKRVIASVKDALSNSKVELASERQVRAELQTRHDRTAMELRNALSKIQSQETDLEIMCEDLSRAENALDCARNRIQELQAESALQANERNAEEVAVTQIFASQATTERAMQRLIHEVAANASLKQGLQLENQEMQRKLKDALDRLYVVEGQLASANAKIFEREDQIQDLRSQVLEMDNARHELDSARGRISVFEMECRHNHELLDQTRSALKQKERELSESNLALQRIFSVASGNQNDGPQEHVNSISSQTSSVCHSFQRLRQQIATLQHMNERSIVEFKRASEAENQRVAVTRNAIKSCAEEMESICSDLQKERGLLGSMGAHFERGKYEFQIIEQQLLNAIDAVTTSDNRLSAATKLTKETMNRSRFQVEMLSSALKSEKQKVHTCETQLNEAKDVLKKLGVEYDLRGRQVEQWKEKFGWKNEEWETARADVKSIRQDLAARERDLADAQAAVWQMHRAVCGRFKRTGIGLRLSCVQDPEIECPKMIVVVDELILGGPADASGKMQVGDVVLSIDDQDPSIMSDDVIRTKLIGSLGSSVTLTVQRRSESVEFQLTLVRRVPNADKQTIAGQSAEVTDCAHALFVEMQQLQGKCSSLSSALEVQQMSTMNMQELNDVLKSDLEKYGRDIMQLRDQIETLEQELDEAQALSKGVECKMTALVKERDALKQDLEACDKKRIHLSEQWEQSQTELQTECSRHREAAKENAGLVADLRGAISKRDSQISLLKLEMERLRGESSRFQVESESVRKQILLLQEAHQQLNTVLMQSRDENTRLLECLESEKRRVESTESKLTIALSGSQRLGMEKASMTSDFQALQIVHGSIVGQSNLVLEQIGEVHLELQSHRADMARLLTEKDELEKSKIETNVSLENALQEIEILKEDAERASGRLKSELENAGALAQEQAEAHAVVLREKGILEIDLSAAKEKIASLGHQLSSVSTEVDLHKVRAMELENELAAEKVCVEKEWERTKRNHDKIQSLEDEMNSVNVLLQKFSGNTSVSGSLVENARESVLIFQNEVTVRSKLEVECEKLQEALSQASAEVQHLHNLRHNDGKVSGELQCDKEALEVKVKFLNESLNKEHNTCIQLIETNETLASDLRDARSRIDLGNERLTAVQAENQNFRQEVGILESKVSLQQEQIETLMTNNHALEHDLLISTTQEARVGEMLKNCEKALEDLQVTETQTAKKAILAQQACMDLRSETGIMRVQLQNSVACIMRLLEELCILQEALKDNEKHSMDLVFVIEGIQNELFAKCQTLKETNFALTAADRERQQLLHASVELDSLMKEHCRVKKSLAHAENDITSLLESLALAQDEATSLTFEFEAVTDLVERQVKQTSTALNRYTPRETKPAALDQHTLITLLTHLEHLREMLDSRKDAKLVEEREKAADDAERLQLQVKKAYEVIECLEQDHVRNSDELFSEKKGHEALARKLILSERKLQECESELQMIVAEQDNIQQKVCIAVRVILDLLRDAMGQSGEAMKFFDFSHNQLCAFKDTYQGAIKSANEEMQVLEKALEQQAYLNNDLNDQLVHARTLESKLSDEMSLLHAKVACMQADVGLLIYDISCELEASKGDVREATWAMERDFSTLQSLVQQRDHEIIETRRQSLRFKDQVQEIECENKQLQTNLDEANALADARKQETDLLCAHMERDKNAADEALRETESLRKNLAQVQEQLARTAQERDAVTNEVREGENKMLEFRAAAKQQLSQLSDQLHAYCKNVQERIMMLQAESEDLHTAIASINKDLGALSADFHREVLNLNGKIFESEAQCKSMCVAIEQQEREISRRAFALERVAKKLQTLMDQLREGDACKHEMYLANQTRVENSIHQLLVHVGIRVRSQRKVAFLFKRWSELSKRQTWALRTAEKFQVRRIRYKVKRTFFQHWTLAAVGSRRRIIVGRWEMLAVAAAVFCLDRHARRISTGLLTGAKKKMFKTSSRAHAAARLCAPVSGEQSSEYFENGFMSPVTSDLQSVQLDSSSAITDLSPDLSSSMRTADSSEFMRASSPEAE